VSPHLALQVGGPTRLRNGGHCNVFLGGGCYGSYEGSCLHRQHGSYRQEQAAASVTLTSLTPAGNGMC
jgi:hypothetical protein